MGEDLAALLAEVRSCRLCHEQLPLGARPILRASPTARLLIVGQAPGTRVHESGIPWSDRSGDRLRGWLGLDKATFYDEARIAIIPVGMCYPGRVEGGGDLPPRPECAPLWHPRLFAVLEAVQLTLVVGSHAQATLLGTRQMTETVRAFESYLPRHFPLPHPSWRTTAWERKNPWFGAGLLPELRARVRTLL
jgi:uracil-DNA glycosylase